MGSDPAEQASVRELGAILDEEVQRLPKKNREALVLCHLEGLGAAQAAKRLGCPLPTLKSRLERARELLRQRLVRRGVTLSVAGVAVVFAQQAASAAVPHKVLHAATQAAVAFAAKPVACAAVSAQAAALAQGMLKTATIAKLSLASFAVLTTAVLSLAVGAGVAGYGGFAGQSQPAQQGTSQSPLAKVNRSQPEKKDQPRALDLYGDPLPEGAVARLGTERFRGGASVALAFSHDGKVLASAEVLDLGGVYLWNAATGRPLHRLPFPNGCRSLAISPDDKLLVAGGENPSLIDIATGKELRRFEVPAGGGFGWCVALSPDGRTVAAGRSWRDFNPPALVLLDVATGKVNHWVSDLIEVGVQSISFSPDGQILASGGNDQTVRLWDVTTGKELRRFEGHEQAVLAVAFSPKGKVLASSDGKEVRFWDVETGKVLQTLKVESHFSPVAFSSNGKLLAYEVRPGTVCLYDPDAGKPIRQWAANTRSVDSLAFSPDGKVLVSAGFSSAIRRWDTATGMEIEPDAGHTGGVASLLFAPDGQTLFSSGIDWKVLEWDMATGRQRRQVFTKPQGLGEAKWPMSNYALAPDSKILAWTGLIHGDEQPDRVVHLWDTGAGKEILALLGPEEQVWSLRFSPNGKHLASISTGGTRLWDVAAGKALHHLREVHGWTFSPDGKLLAGSKRRADKTIGLQTIGLWDVATGKELRSWDSHNDFSGPLVFSPNGKLLASIPAQGGSIDGERFIARVWTIDTGKPLVHFEHQGLIESLAFSPSGRILAAAARSRGPLLKREGRTAYTIHLWDVVSGEEIRHFESPLGPGWSLAFAPNGRTLASGGHDSTILLWDLTTQTNAAGTKPVALTAQDLDRLWADLASDATRPTGPFGFWRARRTEPAAAQTEDAGRPRPRGPGRQADRRSRQPAVRRPRESRQDLG